MKIGIIADDLTGANATGVRMSKSGFRPATYFYNKDIISNEDIDTVIIDTDSRYLNKGILKTRINQSLESLFKCDIDLICKRIDSTMRGNVGNEIDLLLDYVDEDSVAVVVPSFPDSGRVTIGGYLVVNNIPLHKTDVANDPIMPINTSCISEIIESQSKYEVGLLTINELSGNCDDFIEKFKSITQSGKRIVVIDAATNQDIEFIAESLSKVNLPIIPVDSGPFTSAYSKFKANQKVDNSKIIVTVGSATKVTEKQLAYLIDRMDIKPIVPDIYKLASFDDNFENEINRCVRQAKLKLKTSETVIITTNEENLVIIDIQKLAKENSVQPEAVTKRITDGLAIITKKIIDETDYSIKGCFTSGGDVTASLTTIMNANGITLIDEVAPLTAYGTLIDGEYDGLPIITKGGMIGDIRTIYEAIQYLKAT